MEEYLDDCITYYLLYYEMDWDKILQTRVLYFALFCSAWEDNTLTLGGYISFDSLVKSILLNYAPSL